VDVAWLLIAAGACRPAVERLGRRTVEEAVAQATPSDLAWLGAGDGYGDGYGGGDGGGDGGGYGSGDGGGGGYGGGYGSGDGGGGYGYGGGYGSGDGCGGGGYGYDGDGDGCGGSCIEEIAIGGVTLRGEADVRRYLAEYVAAHDEHQRLVDAQYWQQQERQK
jgi:hypothetical protein